MDTTKDTTMQHVTDAVIKELKRAAEHPLKAPVIVRADVMLGVLAQIERLESDLATAEQDSRQKQARIERLEQAEKERDALRAEVIHIKEVEFPRKAQAVADGWRGKCERLEAKIAEMERQEPVAEWLPLDSGEDTRRD